MCEDYSWTGIRQLELERMDGINSDKKSVANKVLRGTIIVMIIGLLAKIAAFVEEAVLAAYLGTTFQSDAYYMVWGIHTMFYPMLSVGIWSVFLPLYKSHLAKDEKEKAYALTNQLISFLTIISVFAVALLFIFAPAVVSVAAPGFSGETRELCIKLTRISSPMYIFLVIAAVYASILQCHDRFLGSQIREVVSHVPTIVAAIFFYRVWGIEAMAISLIVAGILRLLIELPFVTWGYKFRADLHFKSQEFSLLLRRLPPALVSAGVAQFNALVDKAMASTLPEGNVSSLNYGYKLTNVFSGFLSAAISTALYPQMVELIALKKKEELGRLMTKIINLFCILMVPVTLACILFRSELVSAAFERGAFDGNSASAASGVFALYSLGLFFSACNTLFNNVFHGYGDTKKAMYINTAYLITNILLNIAFIQIWGANGLALATSLSTIVSFFIRFVLLKQYVVLKRGYLCITWTKVMLASAVACIIPRSLFWLCDANKYLVLISSASMGCVLYLGMIKLLRIRELSDLVGLVKQKFIKRQKKESVSDTE